MSDLLPETTTGNLRLREVLDVDLPIFFEQQLDPDANHMASFTVKDPTDREAFDARWTRILSDETIRVRTILYDGEVAGSVLSYEEDGKPEVSYWIGKEYWGRGIATWALADFLVHINRNAPSTPALPRIIWPRCASWKSADSRSLVRTKALPTPAMEK
jgi:RimJ/RimL family protein N-acetyltransferase